MQPSNEAASQSSDDPSTDEELPQWFLDSETARRHTLDSFEHTMILVREKLDASPHISGAPLVELSDRFEALAKRIVSTVLNSIRTYFTHFHSAAMVSMFAMLAETTGCFSSWSLCGTSLFQFASASMAMPVLLRVGLYILTLLHVFVPGCSMHTILLLWYVINI